MRIAITGTENSLPDLGPAGSFPALNLIFKSRWSWCRSRFGAALILGAAVVPPASAQLVFNPATDFSATANPNGAWSFGYATTPGQFNLFSSPGDWVGGTVARWNRGLATPNYYPIAFYNYSGAPVVYDSTLTIPAGQFGLHPGPDGSGAEFAVARLTLPVGGTFSLSATFSGLETFGGGTTTDVHVRVAGTSIFDGSIGGFGQTATIAAYQFSAPSGTFVDFLVGGGGNNFIADTTGLSASLTVVPEPSVTALIGLGLCLVVGAAAQKRRQE